mmetsp:Transcript_16382/g.24787  ORF Transcript_16382/g.24787 Transcript_16382/m.24787 type:complete len:285 (-) Transcript_16382:182-1036(-)
MVFLRNIAVSFLLFCNGFTLAAPERRAFVPNPTMTEKFGDPRQQLLHNDNGVMTRGGGIGNASSQRFSSMLDVVISKLFPAGFCWQLASSVCGFDAKSPKFALATGFGEALGVFSGHILYTYLKSKSNGYNSKEATQTALLLATGTICSGTSWQPIVNTLQGMGLSFPGVFIGTWIACTYAFNFGLRIARNLYADSMEYVEGATYDNSRSDFALSLTIGAATAFFVGTDVSMGDSNFLLSLVGIQSDFSMLKGALLAGLSTALGFSAAQTVFNIVFPPGKCWID